MPKTVDEQGNEVLTEYIVMRYGAAYVNEADDIASALRMIKYGEDDGQFSSVGVFVAGEPRIWDGFCETNPPTPKQAAEMRKLYAEAKAGDSGA